MTASERHPLWLDTGRVLADVCAQLAAAGLRLAACDDESADACARRLLTFAFERVSHAEVVVLEAHLSLVAFPLLVMGRVSFHRPIPALRLTHEWRGDPPLGTMIDREAPLIPRRAYLSPRVRPSTFASTIELAAWPLLELVDSETIAREVLAKALAWVGRQAAAS